METPALRELMGTYLHQDYDLIGTVDDNVDAFARDFPDLAPLLPDEVRVLLSGAASDEEIGTHLAALGCQLLPPAGITCREWLIQIAERVRRAIPEPS